MSEYYLILRQAHIACAVATIALFALRGTLMLTDSPLLEARVMKVLPHVIDSVLLTAALMLTMVVHQYPFVNSWLTMKVVLLLAYVALGHLALKAGRPKALRAVAFLAALAVVGFLVSVAVRHDPRGFFAP